MKFKTPEFQLLSDLADFIYSVSKVFVYVQLWLA